LLLGLYRVGDCVMHLCPIFNRRTINVLDDDDDDDDDYIVLYCIALQKTRPWSKCVKPLFGVYKLIQHSFILLQTVV